jgi:8-oxo-dGTP pyrophosphatase MutT (NUDIX family)
VNPSAERPEMHSPVSVRAVVAVLLWHRGKLALFQRSFRVHSDTGLWHCVTGFLESEASPREQAVQEVLEETGLAAGDLLRFEDGPLLELHDEAGAVWRVHTFRAETTVCRLTLNWEHDVYQWVPPSKIRCFGHVAWLNDVVQAFDAA